MVGDDEARVVPGTSHLDVPVGWSGDGRAIFVQNGTALPSRIERVETDTGRRQLRLELTPPDAAGVLVIGPVHPSRDGRACLYSYRRVLDDLYVVEGLS